MASAFRTDARNATARFECCLGYHLLASHPLPVLQPPGQLTFDERIEPPLVLAGPEPVAHLLTVSGEVRSVKLRKPRFPISRKCSAPSLSSVVRRPCSLPL